jgi:hypothetical protein
MSGVYVETDVNVDVVFTVDQLSSCIKVQKHVSPPNALIRLSSAGQRELTSDGV